MSNHERQRREFKAWQAKMRRRYRSREDPCPTCRAGYGLRVDDPDRCGVCITGLSLDGNPIRPVLGNDGVMRCPTCLTSGAKCELAPHNEWPGAWSHGGPGLHRTAKIRRAP